MQGLMWVGGGCLVILSLFALVLVFLWGLRAMAAASSLFRLGLALLGMLLAVCVFCLQFIVGLNLMRNSGFEPSENPPIMG